uniref:TSA: Wollemia nobilis Ref_Wollemi_Transcript_14459_2317 transcribed RNA sequence n=1 Tax=Wollemia nobilis TaxID=56998 RepID=A0A0C9RJL7_9CONI
MEYSRLLSQNLLPLSKPSKPWSCSLIKLCTPLLLFTAAFFVLSAYKKSAAPPQYYHNLFLKAGSNDSIAKHLKKLTQEPHVAGTPENFATADYVFSVFQSSGLDVHYRDYQVLLTYPLSRSISVSLPEGEVIPLKLEEDRIEDDPSTSNPKVIPTFHAYSPSGNVSASVVFANYGREQDYAILRDAGVDPKGAIVIAKYGKIYRGDIVDLAAKAGAVGIVVYSDPEDYGGNRTQGYYPHSKWLPPSGVQRGSIYSELGDPLTPGWPSVPDAEQLSVDDPRTKLPLIPSIPISAEDAALIMKSIGGSVAPAEWHGALDLPDYRLGRGPAVLNLHYKSNHTVTPIRDVFAVIEGSEEPDRYVLLGNHRDAWTFGAGDPNGGTATLLEMAQRLGKLIKRGWRPRRSIILCNWDAEEYALIGSTEWVEENYDLLFSSAVAYLNVDVAVSGPGFDPNSTPQLDDLVKEIANEVEDPDNPGKTIYESWVASIGDSPQPMGRLGGGGSDYAPFVQHAGIAATDFGLGRDFTVYHSIYDDYMWMATFGDPLFHRHVAVGAMWGLIALKLADATILPFNYSTYAHNLQLYVDVLETQLKASDAPSTRVSTLPLHKSIAELRKAAEYITKKAEEAAEGVEEIQLNVRRSLNDLLVMAERAFTDAEGLPGNPWNKHLVYGPTKTDKYGTTSFPGISDMIARVSARGNSWEDVQHQIWRVSRVISRVALVLLGEFT